MISSAVSVILGLITDLFCRCIGHISDVRNWGYAWHSLKMMFSTYVPFIPGGTVIQKDFTQGELLIMWCSIRRIQRVIWLWFCSSNCGQTNFATPTGRLSSFRSPLIPMAPPSMGWYWNAQSLIWLTRESGPRFVAMVKSTISQGILGVDRGLWFNEHGPVETTSMILSFEMITSRMFSRKFTSSKFSLSGGTTNWNLTWSGILDRTWWNNSSSNLVWSGNRCNLFPSNLTDGIRSVSGNR